jgi:hypothetical protein
MLTRGWSNSRISEHAATLLDFDLAVLEIGTAAEQPTDDALPSEEAMDLDG